MPPVGQSALVGLLVLAIFVAAVAKRDALPELPAASRRLGERAEMSTKQLIATGGATVSSVGIVGLIKQDVIGGIVYAATYGFVGFLNGLFDKIGQPITELISGYADVIGSALTGALIDAGFRAAARDIQSYGIIAPIVASVVTFAVAAMVYYLLRKVDISPLKLIYDKFPGT